MKIEIKLHDLSKKRPESWGEEYFLTYRDRWDTAQSTTSIYENSWETISETNTTKKQKRAKEASFFEETCEGNTDFFWAELPEHPSYPNESERTTPEEMGVHPNRKWRVGEKRCDVMGCGCEGACLIQEDEGSFHLLLHDNILPLYRGEKDIEEIKKIIEKHKSGGRR